MDRFEFEIIVRDEWEWNITCSRMGNSDERTVDTGEKVHFSWPTLLSPDYVPRSYIDDNGKAAEPASSI